MVRAPGGCCPRGNLWTEAGVTARSQVAGSGVWADAPAPGVRGLLCPEPRFPEHMPCYCPRPNALPCSLLRPRGAASPGGRWLGPPCWHQTLDTPPTPAGPASPAVPAHARFGDLPGAPLWTASAQHPGTRSWEPGEYIRRTQAGTNTPSPATFRPPAFRQPWFLPPSSGQWRDCSWPGTTPQ